jgi:protease-4
MPLGEADLLVDRRRLKRQISAWRAAAILFALIVIGIAAGRFGAPYFASSYVARLNIAGVIVDDARRTRALEELARETNAKALIVRVDSPGGSVVGGEVLFRQLRQLAAKMPVVAVLGQTAASGGYMTAIGADWIVAREGTVTGSIGVLMQSADVTGLLQKLGVSMEAIKSSPLKAVPSPFETLTEDGRRAVKAVIDDTYELFVGMVAERRGMDRARALAVADGRVFTGRQARALGLVDAVGGEEVAREWLTRERGVKAGLPVRDVRIGREDEFWRDLTSHAFAALTGKSYLPERLTLDGLLALWHPDLHSR